MSGLWWFDWRLDAGGEPRLLEVNPNPGWCCDGHTTKIAGISYADMLGAILKAAEGRFGSQPPAQKIVELPRTPDPQQAAQQMPSQ